MYQICVSGASRPGSAEEFKDVAREAGKAIANAGHTLLTGATIGLPNYASEAYKKAGGAMSVGISPATSKVEHVLKYHLPIEAYDSIVYTGLHYVGRDALLINSADAVVSIGGHVGTLHELMICIETETPVGILLGAGGVSDEIELILKAAGKRPNENIIISDDARQLVKELEAVLNKRHENNLDLYK